MQGLILVPNDAYLELLLEHRAKSLLRPSRPPEESAMLLSHLERKIVPAAFPHRVPLHDPRALSAYPAAALGHPQRLRRSLVRVIQSLLVV